MAWKTEKTDNVEIGKKSYKINLTNTGFNLLFEIYELLASRIYFSINYWPEIRSAIAQASIAVYKNKTFNPIPVSVRGDQKKRIVIARKNGEIILASMESDNRGLTWIHDRDNNKHNNNIMKVKIQSSAREHLIAIKKFFGILDKFYKKIELGEVEKPMQGGHGLFYPLEMIKHDRSMIAFKQLFDDSNFTLQIRLDENKSNIDDKVKIARAQAAKEAKQNKIPFLPEKRGDDGMIQNKTFEDIVYDWEIRRDWYCLVNNIPIYNDSKKTHKFYVVNNPLPSSISELIQSKKGFDTVQLAVQFVKKTGLKSNRPSFIFTTFGQFGRKIEKPEISLSIQCTQTAPQWPKINDYGNSYFAVAWHEDFKNPKTVVRTTENKQGEMGTMFETSNFMVYPFNEEGVRRFKLSLDNQFKSGTTHDKNGNSIPKIRKWI